MNPVYFVVVGVILFCLLLAKKLTVGHLYLWVCLTTEFFYIFAFGGILRPYHLLSAALLPFFFREIDKSVASASIRGLVAFLTLNFLSSLIVVTWRSALLSYMLLVANAVVALAIFCVMLRFFDREKIASLVLAVGVVTAVVGLVQFAGSRLGLDMAFSSTQQPFVSSGEVATFWTEPDQMGKFLSMPFLLALVQAVHRKEHAGIALVLVGVGIMLNFVRSPIYGLIPAVLVLGIVVVRQRRLRRFFGVLLGAMLVLALFIVLVYAGLIPLGAYPVERLARVMNVGYASLAADGSGGYRIQSMQMLLQQTLSAPQTVLFGLGLSQASGVIGGNMVMLGGGDLVNLFGGSGMLGVLSYLLLVAPLFYIPLRHLRRDKDDWFAQWLLVTAVAFVVSGQLTGMLLMPQFWFLVAANAFMEYSSRAARDHAGYAGVLHAHQSRKVETYE